MPCICTVSTSSSATEVGRIGSGCAGPVGWGMAAACTCASSHRWAFRDDSARCPTAMLADPHRHRVSRRHNTEALNLVFASASYAAVKQTASFMSDTHCVSCTPLPPGLLSTESVDNRETAVRDPSGSLSLRVLCKEPHLLPGWL